MDMRIVSIKARRLVSGVAATLVALGVVVAAGMPGAVATSATEANVTASSPAGLFPQNKQNEPAVAVNPIDSNIVVAGANEEVDEPPCDGNNCPFAQGVGNSGIYISTNGGSSWVQPTYSGWSGRTGTLQPGPIGTIPHYYEHGLVSDGDPWLAFGPRPDGNGFSYSGGARLYYANLTSNFATKRKDDTFKGYEAIAVSHVDDIAAAAAGDASAWSEPAIVTSQNQSGGTFSDKESIAADDAESSPHFGNVYVCYTRFQGGPAETIDVTRSSDGGDTWSKPIRLTAAYNGTAQAGRQGCVVDTDSDGVVYLVWEDTVHHQSVFKMARSFDGGVTFDDPFVIVPNVSDVGIFDGVRSISFDGVAGARTSSFPSLAIANGAPTGTDAADTIVVGWSNGSLNHEHALAQLSSDGGDSWSDPQAVEESGDRPDFAFLDISPDGTDLYVIYDGFVDPFRHQTSTVRRFAGVLRHADVSGTTLSNVMTLHRGQLGDARASSANALIDEFIGDYNTVDATNDGAVTVFNDVRNAAVCTAINRFRQTIVDGTAGAAPAPGTDCPATFGNTDIYSAAAADPS